MQITNCKLGKRVQKKLLEFFVLQVTARSAADILGIHPNSAALFYRKIRTVINYHLALAADEVFEDPVELDESYFGGRRKGRRGRGAAGKVVVFGILKRNGRVYTVVVDTHARGLGRSGFVFSGSLFHRIRHTPAQCPATVICSSSREPVLWALRLRASLAAPAMLGSMSCRRLAMVISCTG